MAHSCVHLHTNMLTYTHNTHTHIKNDILHQKTESSQMTIEGKCMHCVCTVDCSSALKRAAILTFTTNLMSLEDMLSIISQAPMKSTVCFHLYELTTTLKAKGWKELRDGQRKRGRGKRVSVDYVCCSVLEDESMQAMESKDGCSRCESTSCHRAVHPMYKAMSFHI